MFCKKKKTEGETNDEHKGGVAHTEKTPHRISLSLTGGLLLQLPENSKNRNLFFYAALATEPPFYKVFDLFYLTRFIQTHPAAWILVNR